jgi:DGQHR domain-containing protein
MKKEEQTNQQKLNAIQFTQRMGGKEYKMYFTSFPAEALSEKARVDVYHAGSRPHGYQREPVESRFRQISRYVTTNEGLLPTAILVNIRHGDEGAEFESKSEFDGGSFGILKLPSDATLWVVDGQHRLYGVKRAADDLAKTSPGESLGYQLPVVFTIGLDLIEEMRLFHIVNSKIKSVPTDLAAELLRRAVEKDGRQFVHSGKGSEKDFRKAIGSEVATHLNSTAGPWQGKIRLPNEPKDMKRKPLQINAIASSLEPALVDPYIKSMCEAETKDRWPTFRGIVFTYWTALAQLMEEAFADVEQYSVQRTTGTYTFHLILPDVLYRCRERGDFSVETFKDILQHLGRWVNSGTWHLKDGDLSTFATGMKSIRQLAETMRAELPPFSMPGLSKPSVAKPQQAAA